MIKVALCDDNELEMSLYEKKILTCFSSLGCPCDIRKFSSGDELLKHDGWNEVDVIFLDIEMPGTSGIETAGKLADNSTDVNTIFLTNRDDLVFHAIRHKPFRFIRKNKIDEELTEAVQSVVAKIANETIFYEFRTDKKPVKRKIKDIVFFESCKHNLNIHSLNGEKDVIRGSIGEYESKLASLGFIRVHSGFLVNVRYIYSVSTKGVELDDGRFIPVSRKNMNDIKQKHLQYMRKHIYGDN